MRKSKPILFLLILCLAVTLCVPALAVDTPANYSAGGEAQPAPEIHARCALLCDLESGQTYYARNADQKAYPASLTKIMTVLLALEALDRGDQMSAIAARGAPRLLVSRAVTTERPTKPTPTFRPLPRAFPGLMPMQMPRIVKMTGIMTAAPSPMI